MQFHLKPSASARISSPVIPALRFQHQLGMFGTCHAVNALLNFENIGGARFFPTTNDWLIWIDGLDLRPYQHNPNISIAENLAIIDALIGEAFAKARAQ